MIITVFLTTNCSLGRKLSKQDIILESAYQTIHWIDWYQTRNIDYDKGYYEQNIILGKYPSDKKIDIYFTTTSLGHLVLTKYLPKKYSRIWLYITISGESIVVVRNNFK